MDVLMVLLFSIVAGILPMVLYAVILWWFDRYEKEPTALLAAAFFWGAVPAIVFSLIVELILDYPIRQFVDPAAADLIGAAMIAPLAEESFKGAALLLMMILFRREIDSPLDGIIYGAMVGFGFAAVENIVYFIGSSAEGAEVLGLTVVLRAVVFGLNHAMFTGFIGLGLALARASRNVLAKLAFAVVGFVMGIGAHVVHNLTVSLAEQIWPCLVTFVSAYGGVLFLFGVIIWATIRERGWIVTYLADEVRRGTLSAEDYEITGSWFKRMGVRLRALFTGNVRGWWQLGRYYRLATELAFNKQRLSHFPGEQDTQKQILTLREQVRGMKPPAPPSAAPEPASQPAPPAAGRARYCAGCGRSYRPSEANLDACPVCHTPRAG